MIIRAKPAMIRHIALGSAASYEEDWMNHETIVILDNGSAVGQLVSRATRDMGVYSVLAPFDIAQEKLMEKSPLLLYTSRCV